MVIIDIPFINFSKNIYFSLYLENHNGTIHTEISIHTDITFNMAFIILFNM